VDRREIELHGHRMLFREAGAGPPVVLIHGMVNSSRHWEQVGDALAQDYRVVAPDLLGHGNSAKPEGDYSLGAHAAGVRDLLAALSIDRATIVGHSLGGGVAMQFYYQFPERCERLALISSGGLGREVTAALRAAALPGAGPALALATRRRVVAIERAGLRAVARTLRSLEEPDARRAFLWTLRSVIDERGQRVSAHDRLYLAGALPTLVVWGDRDRTIPMEHGIAARDAIPGARLELLPGAGHYPHIQMPEALAIVLRDFIATTEPALVDRAVWRALLLDRAAPGVRERAAEEARRP
jgi:pimeloyl-ACP methyl ester carboxylesterase